MASDHEESSSTPYRKRKHGQDKSINKERCSRVMDNDCSTPGNKPRKGASKAKPKANIDSVEKKTKPRAPAMKSNGERKPNNNTNNLGKKGPSTK